MVRETRYLWVANLPDTVNEDQIAEYFGRHGKIQSVRLVPVGSDARTCSGSASASASGGAVVAFMDIRCASRAHDSVNTIDGSTLITMYNESSTTPAPVLSVPVAVPVAVQVPASSAPVTSSTESTPCSARDARRHADRRSPGLNGSTGSAKCHRRSDGGGPSGDVSTTTRPSHRSHRRHHLTSSSPSSSTSLVASSTSGPSPGRVAGDALPRCAGSTSPPDPSRRSRSRGSSCSGSYSHGDGVGVGVDRGHDRLTRRSSPGSSSHGTASDSTVTSDTAPGSGRDKKPVGMMIRGFPARSSNSSVRDGLFHEYKKYGKVTSVHISGTGDERQAIVSFKKHEDAMRALDASHEKRFFGSKVTVSIHDGVELDSCEFRLPESDLDEFHHKATRTLFIGNLDKSVTKDVLRDTFNKFGHIVDVEIKHQSHSLSYAFVQFDNILSVVTALREMDGEQIGLNKIKLGFGRSMPTFCVWLADIDDALSEKYLAEQFSRYGVVTATFIDRRSSRALVFFDGIEHAQRAVNDVKNRPVKDRHLQVDFASRECQNVFLDGLEKSGQLRSADRYAAFPEYTARHRRQYREGHRDRFVDYNSSRVPSTPLSRYLPARYPDLPSTPTGTRANSRGGFYDAYEHRDGLGPPPAPSRGLHKYHDGDDVISDYGGFEADQRRSHRCNDSPSSVGCRNGRYTSPGAHDDVFLDRCESKSQPDWDSNSRSGYRSSDDRTSSRGGQHGHSPSDSDRNRGGLSRSRTSQSISPVRRRYSKEHRVSPSVSCSRDCSRHDDRADRHNSLESPDRDVYSSRSSDVGRSWSHGAGDCVKPRTVANDIDGDNNTIADRDRLLRTSDSGGGARRAVAVSSDVSRRHTDKEPSRSNTVRSVVNTTPSWRFESDYKHSLRGADRQSESFVVDSNHIGLALQKLRSETIEVISDSTSSQSKSPHAVSDAEESVSGAHPDRPPSKGSDDMSHLEKEKSHLLNMLKELEDYSSGGSEIEGLDEESRAVLHRLHCQRDKTGDNDSDVSGANAKRGTCVDGTGQVAVTAARVLDRDVSKSGGESRSIPVKSDTISSRRLSETSRRLSTSSDTKKRRVSLENHVGPVITSSLDAEDNIIDLIGSSPPAEIPTEFTRRHRSSSEVTAAAPADQGVKPRRSYRPRESGDSADSGPEDVHSTSAAKTAMLRQSNDRGAAPRQEVPSGSSAAVPVVHRTQSLEDVTLTSRRASTSGPTRKGSGGDHQPCIIPDSPVTTRGPDIRPPTEPRTMSLTTTAGGRTIMDLPLPRFGFDRHRLRHLSASAAVSVDSITSSSSTMVRVETAVACTPVSNAVTLKTDVAPFSPGLLSPAMSPPAVRLDTSAATTVGMLGSCSVSSQPAATQDKSEAEMQLSVTLPDDVVSSDAMQKETTHLVDSAVEKSDAVSAEAVKQIVSDEVSCDKVDTIAEKVELKLEPASEKLVENSGTEVVEVTVPVSASDAAVKEEPSVVICDSDVSDLLSPGSPPDTLSLEDRIRALDEKLNQIQQTTPRQLPSSELTGLTSSPFDYSKFIRRRKPPSTPTTGADGSATNEPSEYVKSLLSRTSIFDQDSQRLEQLHSKFDAAVSVSGSVCGLTECASSSLVSRMRYAGRFPAHDLTLQLPLSASALHSSPYPSSSAPGYRSSDISMPLSSPGASYCSRGASLLTPPPSSWSVPAVTVTAVGSGWTSSWSGPSVAVPSPAVHVTSTPGSAAVRLSSYLPYGMPQTPGTVSSSSVPTDPRRVPRSADVFPSPLSVRRQESHASDTVSDIWAVNSSARREHEVVTVAGKPKEMVSPPVSILKKTTTSSTTKDDVTCVNAKSSDGSQSCVVASSAGVKRSADVAFGKESTLSTPNKIVARTPKTVPQPSAVSEAEGYSSTNKVAELDTQKTQTTILKRPEPAKRPVQSKPLTAKVDDKKTDHGTVTSGRKVSEDTSKSGSAVKPQNKAHSTTSSSLSVSSVSTASKSSHTHRDSKPANTDSLRHTSGPKESSGVSSDLTDKHSSSHVSGGSNKPKTSHSASKEMTTKERTVDDQEKLMKCDDKDSAGREKSLSHGSSKQHLSSEHRYLDKATRDGKPDDAGKTSKVALPSSTSKTALKTVARDPTKPDKILHMKPKSETNSSVKKENLESGKKDVAGHLKTSSSSKSEREHKAEKDETNRDKMSLSNMQSKPSKKPGADSTSTSRTTTSLKHVSTNSSKPKHSDRSSSDRKNEGKKQEASQSDKSKKPQSSSSDKNKTMKKKSEKRPEEKREVKALLQEMANFEDTEPVNQYQSMYDMVKRRSNKEREKEDHMKEMESRAKSLNKLASSRRRGKVVKLRSSDDEMSTEPSRKCSTESARALTTSSSKSARAVVTSSDSESSSTSSDDEADAGRHRSSAAKPTSAAVSKPRVITSSSDSDDTSDDDVESVTLLKNRVTPEKSRKTAAATSTPLPRQSIYTSSDNDDDSDSDSVSGTPLKDSVSVTPLKKVKPLSSMLTPPSSKPQSKKPAQSASKKPPLSAPSGSSKPASKPFVARESSTDSDVTATAKNSRSTVKDVKKQHRDNQPDSVLGQASKKEVKNLPKSTSDKPVPHHHASSLFGDALAKSAIPTKIRSKTGMDGKEEKGSRKDLTSPRSSDKHKSTSSMSTVSSVVDRTKPNKPSHPDVSLVKSKHSVSESRHAPKLTSGTAEKKSGSERAQKSGYDLARENISRKILESEALTTKKMKQDEQHVEKCRDAVESDESPVIRPGNIFEKMEKQDSSCDKSDEARMFGHSDAASHRRSVASEIAVFMPESDDDDREPIIETAKLSIERLKEDSAKEETIEEAVKTIIEITKEPSTPPVSSSKATDSEPPEDTSGEIADDDIGLSDDVGELNAAIGNLIEKELEPASGDGVTSENISSDKSSESDTSVSPTHFRPTTHGGPAEPKNELSAFVGAKSSSGFKEEHGAMKMDVDSVARHIQTSAHDEQNVTSFMSRLEKATADAVDFAAISAAAAASRKLPEKVSAEVTPCSKPEVSSRLFVSAIASTPIKSEDEKPIAVKKECLEPAETVKAEPPEFPLSTRIFSSSKQPEIHGTSSAEKAVAGGEPASSEDSSAMTDLYEFKDDDDEASTRQKDFVLHKRSRKRHADSESNDAADVVDSKKSRGSIGSHVKVEQHEVVSATTTEQCPTTTTSVADSQPQSSWRTNMDVVIDAVARGEFERGDDFNYYSSQNPSTSTGRGRRGRGASRDDVTHKSVPASTPSCLASSLPNLSVEAYNAALLQRSLSAVAAVTSSALAGGRCSPKLLLSGMPSPQQLQQLQRMYPPGSLSANPGGIQSAVAAVSPSGFPMLIQRPGSIPPEILAAEQHRRPTATTPLQQHVTAASLATRIPVVAEQQPLVVAVSRSAHSAATMASPVTPIDAHAAGQLLLRSGVIPTTCHSASAAVMTTVSARTAPLTVDTAVPTSMLPLIVTTDAASSAALNKVRHMSPEIAKSLLQPSGPYQMPAVSAYLSAVGRSPASAHPFSSYAAGVMASPLESTRHSSSPAPSDLREALAQPSRLAQQEQLLAKQRVQQMVPLLAAAGVRAAVGGGELCRSPVGLGQHRMPFTVLEPRSMSASRAEPKAVPQSTPPEPPLQRLPPPSSASDLSVSHSTDLGGSFAPGRLEPPHSAAAMLSNTFIGPSPVDLVMAAPHHHAQQQHAVDLGVLHRFHPAARPGLDTVRVPLPSTAAYSPALPGMMGPRPAPLSHLTSVPNCVSGRESPLVTSTSTLGDLQNETFIMNTTKVLERLPLVWTGQLVLKNDVAAVRMHYVSGNQDLVRASLPPEALMQDGSGTTLSQLRISQRMRLDPSQLDQVSKRMETESEYSVLLAVPCARDPVEVMTQGHNLRTGFINYLQQKHAAGIVNIQEPGSSQAAYVVHIFPPCQFSLQNLSHVSADVMHSCNELGYLLIVITTC